MINYKDYKPLKLFRAVIISLLLNISYDCVFTYYGINFNESKYVMTIVLKKLCEKLICHIDSLLNYFMMTIQSFEYIIFWSCFAKE